jgi:phosphoglycolate phosphatase
MQHKIQAVIFDMDGTILNTLDDLTGSLNYALAQTGHRHDYVPDDVKHFFGSGVRVAISRALAEEGRPDVPEDDPEVERIREVFAPHYAEHCNDHTGPYAGIPECIAALRDRGILTAVVSNKPDFAVQTLAKEIFPGCFDLAVGEQTGVRRKPAPDMTVKAMKDLKVAQANAVYVGDSEVDLATARNSELPCIAVSWGFRSVDFLKAQGASVIVDRASEIVDWVDAQNA